MKTTGRAEFWLPAALLVLTAIGGVLLTQDSCVHLEERDRNAYGLRPKWLATFDAMSASCGAGLLTYDLRDDYTPLGRGVLAGLGLAGALLYVAATHQVVTRLFVRQGRTVPSLRVVLVAYGVLQLLIVPGVWVAFAAGRGGAADIPGALWQAVSFFSSLGWVQGSPNQAASGVYVVSAGLAAAGWAVWLLVVPAKRFQVASPALIVEALLSYLIFLALAAGAITMLEVPRGVPQGRATVATQADQEAGARFTRSLTQVVCAAGSGVATVDARDRGVSEGTKVVLAGVMLVGGLGGSACGGIGWLLILWAAAGGAIRSGSGGPNELTRRCAYAGVLSTVILCGLVLVVAIGLLGLEANTASRYETPPSFADAVLDAASAVGGGNLTSGVTATVTSASLSRGIRQSVDQYQYGLIWLMTSMFIGRILVVLVVARVSNSAPGLEPLRLPSRP